MKNDKDTKQAYGDLVRRRTIVQGLMDKTRQQIEALMEMVQKPEADPRDIVRLQLLTFQGNILVRVMAQIADEAAKLTLELERPTINLNEIEIPDSLPEEL